MIYDFRIASPDRENARTILQVMLRCIRTTIHKTCFLPPLFCGDLKIQYEFKTTTKNNNNNNTAIGLKIHIYKLHFSSEIVLTSFFFSNNLCIIAYHISICSINLICSFFFLRDSPTKIQHHIYFYSN